jgi:hypothetical protein
MPEHDVNVPDVLMKKYALLKQEVWDDMRVHREHIKYLYLLITALFGLLAASVSGTQLGGLFLDFRALSLLSFLVMLITNYIGYHVFDGIYGMTVASARMAVIEQTLNAMAKTTLLCWESSTKIRDMYTNRRPFSEARIWFVSPLWVLGRLQIVVSILILAAVPAYTAYVFHHRLCDGSKATVFFWTVQAISAVSLCVFWYIATVVLGKVRGMAFHDMSALRYTDQNSFLQLPREG